MTVSFDQILADHMSGETRVEFAVDVWEADNMPPDAYGIVSLAGVAEYQRADNRIVEEAYRYDVELYVPRGTVGWAKKIMNALEALDDLDEYYCVWSMPERKYLVSIDKVLWHFRVVKHGKCEWEEPEEEAP